MPSGSSFKVVGGSYSITVDIQNKKLIANTNELAITEISGNIISAETKGSETTAELDRVTGKAFVTTTKDTANGIWLVEFEGYCK
jgi:hypothetical protein